MVKRALRPSRTNCRSQSLRQCCGQSVSQPKVERYSKLEAHHKPPLSAVASILHCLLATGRARMGSVNAALLFPSFVGEFVYLRQCLSNFGSIHFGAVVNTFSHHTPPALLAVPCLLTASRASTRSSNSAFLFPRAIRYFVHVGQCFSNFCLKLSLFDIRDVHGTPPFRTTRLNILRIGNRCEGRVRRSERFLVRSWTEGGIVSCLQFVVRQLQTIRSTRRG